VGGKPARQETGESGESASTESVEDKTPLLKNKEE